MAMALLKEGEKVPVSVKAKDSRGREVSLREVLGQWVVLYFYPKDDTTGCTVEAEGFRDRMADFKTQGVVVIGVSKDSPATHQKFMGKVSINFELWSDEEHKLMEAFGTWQEKKFMGKTYMGTTRSTFVINPEGNVARVWEKVQPKGHAEEVFEFVSNMQDK